MLENGAKVYKLIGPALLRQDLKEVKQNINKRLEFIVNESYLIIERKNNIYRKKVEMLMKDSEQKQLATRNKVQWRNKKV